MSLRMQFMRIIKVIIEYAGIHLALNPCKKFNFLSLKQVFISDSCTCIRNKYLCKSEFVWNVHKQVTLKVISFSIGLHPKHAWACWDSAKAIDFECPRLTRAKWTLALYYMHYRECKAKCRMDWSYGKHCICLHVV